MEIFRAETFSDNNKINSFFLFVIQIDSPLRKNREQDTKNYNRLTRKKNNTKKSAGRG